MKLMVCFDGSSAANYALHVAKKRAEKLGGQILLVTSMAGGKDVSAEAYETSEKLLEKAKFSVEEAGLPCESLLSVRAGASGDNLSRIAKEREVDEIYLGIKKRSKVGKLLFGSTAQFIILNAPCPVVTVKN